MGIDKSIVYERYGKCIYVPSNIHNKLKQSSGSFFDTKDFASEFESSRYLSKKDEYNELIVIGFCGKLYVGIKYVKTYYSKKNCTPITKTEIIYDHNKIRKNLKKEDDEYKKSKYYWRKSSSNVKNFENYLLKLKSIDSTKWHREFNSPIFAYGNPIKLDWEFNKAEDGNFYINPCLKDYQFMKVFDPYTAFQEIQMYISGILGTKENDTIDISNEDRIVQYGYDKWSFRREPTKK
jgi:hypothetical protein